MNEKAMARRAKRPSLTNLRSKDPVQLQVEAMEERVLKCLGFATRHVKKPKRIFSRYGGSFFKQSRLPARFRVHGMHVPF